MYMYVYACECPLLFPHRYGMPWNAIECHCDNYQPLAQNFGRHGPQRTFYYSTWVTSSSAWMGGVPGDGGTKNGNSETLLGESGGVETHRSGEIVETRPRMLIQHLKAVKQKPFSTTLTILILSHPFSIFLPYLITGPQLPNGVVDHLFHHKSSTGRTPGLVLI